MSASLKTILNVRSDYGWYL